MENTIENKAKLFAIYHGQKVHRVPQNNILHEVNYESYLHLDDEDWLELTPLSQISDEDAIEVAKRNPYAAYKEGIDKCDYIKHVKENIKTMVIITPISDYLRSKGYAIPYMGVSVEEQINRGWAKIKSE